jgi:hypothetical protein
VKNTKKPIQSDEIENNDIEFPIVKDQPEWLKYTLPVKRKDNFRENIFSRPRNSTISTFQNNTPPNRLRGEVNLD